MDYMAEFARRLKSKREALHLTQAQLADKIKVSSQTISAYEKNSSGEKGKTPTLDKAVALAQTLGVSLDSLCGLNEQSSGASGVNIQTIADVVDYLNRLPQYFGPYSCFIGTKEVHLDEEECYSIPRGYDGLGDEWVTTMVAATITIKNETLSDFISKRNKMYKLLSSGVIDQDIYSSWLSAETEKLKKFSLQPFPGGSDFGDESTEVDFL